MHWLRSITPFLAAVLLTACGDQDAQIAEPGGGDRSPGATDKAGNTVDAGAPATEAGTPPGGPTDEAAGTDDDAGPDDPNAQPAPAPPPSSVPPKPLEVFFNDPAVANDRALEEKLEQLIAMTPAGASIKLTMYGFSRSTPAKALIAAHQRGVDVRVVLDGTNAGNAATTMLQQNIPDAVTLCTRGKGACIGDNINHNKFVLFSALSDGSKNVVWQSSANLTGGQLTVHNNAVLSRGDAALYTGYEKYFGDLAAQAKNLDYNGGAEGSSKNADGSSKLKAYYFPRAAGDTITGVLDNVTCTKNEPGTIHVAMAFFLNSRVAIADKLGALKKQGCTVEVLVNSDSDHIGGDILDALKKGGVAFRQFMPTGAARLIHSKYLLIDALYGDAGTTRRKLVFTGSHNYAVSALRANDETLLRVIDDNAHAAFEANYAKIRLSTK